MFKTCLVQRIVRGLESVREPMSGASKAARAGLPAEIRGHFERAQEGYESLLQLRRMARDGYAPSFAAMRLLPVVRYARRAEFENDPSSWRALYLLADIGHEGSLTALGRLARVSADALYYLSCLAIGRHTGAIDQLRLLNDRPIDDLVVLISRDRNWRGVVGLHGLSLSGHRNADPTLAALDPQPLLSNLGRLHLEEIERGSPLFSHADLASILIDHGNSQVSPTLRNLALQDTWYLGLMDQIEATGRRMPENQWQEVNPDPFIETLAEAQFENGGGILQPAVDRAKQIVKKMAEAGIERVWQELARMAQACPIVVDLLENLSSTTSRREPALEILRHTDVRHHIGEIRWASLNGDHERRRCHLEAVRQMAGSGNEMARSGLIALLDEEDTWWEGQHWAGPRKEWFDWDGLGEERIFEAAQRSTAAFRGLPAERAGAIDLSRLYEATAVKTRFVEGVFGGRVVEDQLSIPSSALRRLPIEGLIDEILAGKGSPYNLLRFHRAGHPAAASGIARIYQWGDASNSMMALQILSELATIQGDPTFRTLPLDILFRHEPRTEYRLSWLLAFIEAGHSEAQTELMKLDLSELEEAYERALFVSRSSMMWAAAVNHEQLLAVAAEKGHPQAAAILTRRYFTSPTLQLSAMPTLREAGITVDLVAAAQAHTQREAPPPLAVAALLSPRPIPSDPHPLPPRDVSLDFPHVEMSVDSLDATRTLEMFLEKLQLIDENKGLFFRVGSRQEGLDALKLWALRHRRLPEGSRWEISLGIRRMGTRLIGRTEYALISTRNDEAVDDFPGWTQIAHTHPFEEEETNVLPSVYDLRELLERPRLQEEGCLLITSFGIARASVERDGVAIRYEMAHRSPDFFEVFYRSSRRLWRMLGGDPRTVVLYRPPLPVYIIDSEGKKHFLHRGDSKP